MTRKKISLFVILTFAISSVSYYVMVTDRSRSTIGALFMWSPGIAAILTQLFFRGNLRDFGWKLGKVKYLVLGLGVPLIYASLIYGFVWITRLGEFSPISTQKILIYATLGLFFACAAALGEEIGWRGLLIPELLKITTFTKATLITGIIWSVWHFPAIIFTDYNNRTPLIFQLVIFTITVIGLSIFSAWLRIKSGSMWPAVLWHGAHNLFIQQIFLSMTLETGLSEYFVDDFGLGLTFACLVLGIIYWKKRVQLPESQIDNPPTNFTTKTA